MPDALVPKLGRAELEVCAPTDRRRHRLQGLLTICLAFVGVVQVQAQDGAMGQGEATIAVRSDVKLSVKGTGGTTSERLSKLGQAVSEQMGDIRACYRKQVAGSPEVTGSLRLRIALDKTDKPDVEILDGAESSQVLATCVLHALRAGHYRDVGRPAQALLGLDFENSRARGQAQMVERKNQLAHVEAHDTLDGMREAAWATDGDEVRFTVKTAASFGSEAPPLVLRGFQVEYAAFLDCRRKCEKGGISPEGDIAVELDIDTKGKSKAQLGQITVRHDRARGCAEHAFKKIRFDAPTSALRAHVDVHFAP
jgi:hypothetical protein